MIGRLVHPGLVDDDITGPDRDPLPSKRAAGEVSAPYLLTHIAASGTVRLVLTRTCGKAINAALNCLHLVCQSVDCSKRALFAYGRGRGAAIFGDRARTLTAWLGMALQSRRT